MEADTNVTSIEFIKRDTSWYGEDFIASACITDEEEPECWVIGGTTPMNLYAKSQFDNPDEAFSLHLGTIGRVIQEKMKDKASAGSDQVGYDAFVCHASEDKDKFVRPLAEELTQKGLRIWYDEFELDVGDSLRESIDRGLSQSAYGIVILSESFFGKGWTEYELNGLTAREAEGDKVILPVWYNIGKSDVMEYSPPLADKVAVQASRDDVEETAEELYGAIMKDAVQRISGVSDSQISQTRTPPSQGLDDQELSLQNQMIRRDYQEFYDNPVAHVVHRQPHVNNPIKDWDADSETVRKVWKITTDDGFYRKRDKSWKLTPKGVDRAEELGEEILLSEDIQEEILHFLIQKYNERPMRAVVQRDTLLDELDCSEKEVDHNVWLLGEKGFVDTEGYLGDSRGYSQVEITQLGRRVTE